MSSPTPRLLVRKLTLFSHGLAQLELAAEVDGDTKLQYTFPENHMNDILKSLTVVDTKGTISCITYSAPSADTEWRQPKLEVGKSEALKSLLHGAQGASIVVYVGDQAIAGMLLGLQWPLILAGDKEKTADEVKLVVMEPGWRVITYKLSEVDSIQFEDPQFQKQLDALGQIDTGSKKEKNKSVTIITKGTEKRSVIVNYAVENPVPKLTYRFLLNHSSNTAESVFIQGWAVVDNPTDHDFEDIDMAIVSGMPMSFRHDLYSSRYAHRPTEKVNTKKAHGKPSDATLGFGGSAETPTPSTFGSAKPPPAPGGQFGSLFGGARPELNTFQARRRSDHTTDAREGVEETGFGAGWQDDAIRNQTSVVEAENSEIGNLYEYSIPVKVSIKARESALVPLIMREVDGSQVDIYSRKVQTKNTLSAVRIRNTTDAAFEAGPVCVFEKSRLVGEGMMKSCRPFSETFVPYSVNLDCTVDMKKDYVDGGIVKVRIVGEMFEMVRETKRVVEYTFERRVEGVVYVLHEIEPNFEAPSASKVTHHTEEKSGESGEGENVEVRDIVDGIARFRVLIPGKRSVTLRVTEKKPGTEMKGIRGSCTESEINELVKNNAIKLSMTSTMREVMEKEREIAEIRTEYFKYSTEAQRLKESQQRLRSNIASLGRFQNADSSADDAGIKQFVDGLASTEEGIQDMEKWMASAEERGRNVEKAVTELIKKMGKVDETTED